MMKTEQKYNKWLVYFLTTVAVALFLVLVIFPSKIFSFRVDSGISAQGNLSLAGRGASQTQCDGTLGYVDAQGEIHVIFDHPDVEPRIGGHGVIDR